MLLFCIVLSLFFLPYIRFNFVQACADGFYGEGDNCTECGVCKDKMCESDGFCTKGCEPGWAGDTCHQPCYEGYYGQNCSETCGACKDKRCSSNGSCIFGCEPDWIGVSCDQACDDGFYGQNCSRTCGACIDKKCVSEGSCIYGCEPGWAADKCLECEDGFYGKNCSLICGACNDRKCDSNGSCIFGCEEDWIGDSCDQESILIKQAAVEEPTTDGISPFGIITIVAGVCLLLVGILILATTIKNRNRQTSSVLKSVTSKGREAEEGHIELEAVEVESMEEGKAEQISVERKDKTGKEDSSSMKEDYSRRTEDYSRIKDEDKTGKEDGSTEEYSDEV